MRNLESILLPESKERAPLKSGDLEEGSLDRKFILVPSHSKNIEDKNKADTLLKKISTPYRSQEEVPQKEKNTINQLDLIHLETLQLKAEKVKRIVTNVTDFVPIIGSIKMIMEGWNGKQYGTEKEVKGVGRVVHTASGVIFLALDLTGIGAIASELGKGALKVGERAVVKSIEATLAREVVEKEVTKLMIRGNTRIDKKEKIQHSV